jgi:hypothetical protein
MGLPLSPLIANFFMEEYDEDALNRATHKLHCWFQYTDDTLVIWPHGPQELGKFLLHLNSIPQHPIQHGGEDRGPHTLTGP